MNYQYQSERTHSQRKPRFLRLSLRKKKEQDELRFYADEEYMIRVVPNRKGS